MRVISGTWRGRKIASPPLGDKRIRPTSDRVRENLFNILTSTFGGALQGLSVADICAGTGALGLEALSRGAASCLFLEKDAAARALIEQNISSLGAEQKSRILLADAARLPLAPHAVDLILFDPPYAADFVPAAMDAMAAQGWAKSGTVLTVEQASDTAVSSTAWTALSHRRYGSSTLHLFQMA